MAKGNLLLGMARGKVGDIVVTRGAGEQISRARNRNPKNPKTTKQMAQRAALATCVEFFTRGRKNLFKFAFENKRKGESDYNAFVRANIGHVPVQSRKTLVENGAVFGKFVLSQGSLVQPAFEFDGNSENGSMFCRALPHPAATLTIGELSQAIAEYNGFENGDIITLVAILATGGSPVSTLEDAIAAKELVSGQIVTKWIVRQFTLDFNSTALATTLGLFELDSTSQGATKISLVEDVFELAYSDPDIVQMLGVIASRNTPSGLKVSTSVLELSDASVAAAEVGMSDDWKVWAAQHWNEAASLDVAPENILEGSISEN